MPGFMAANGANAPPPAYERAIRRVYPHSLRFVAMFTSLIGLLWGVSLGVQNLRYRNDDDESSKEQLFDILVAVFYLVVAVVEAAALAVCFLNRMPVGRLLVILAPLGVAMLFAAQVLQVVEHFVAKTDLINQCVESYTNGTLVDGLDDETTLTSSEATSDCTSSWNHDTVTVVAWLIVGSIVGGMFGLIALGYHRQLVDPSLVQPRVSREQAIPLQPTYSQQAWMVPPYPGPPPANPPPFEKSEYMPSAEWAEAGYAPPSGPPPGHAGLEAGGSHRAEEEAWERARREGVTAHLTGHGPAPVEQESDGYVIPNREEDDAWEQARAEGVTAHLTGAGAAQRREGAV